MLVSNSLEGSIWLRYGVSWTSISTPLDILRRTDMQHDPSIERWAAMRENVYQHFKFTRRNTRTIMLLGVVVPVAIGALCLKYDVS